MNKLRNTLRSLVFRTPVIGRRYRTLLEAAESHYRINPGHYYSPIPSEDDIQRELQTAAKPNDVTDDALPGIPLRTEEQLGLLHEFKPLMAAHSFPEHAHPKFRYHYRNDWFQYTDGLILQAFLRRFRPQRIIEVGSGFSSAAILDTVELDPNLQPSITLIEPNSARLKAGLHSGDEQRFQLIESTLQDAPADIFDELTAGDILLIDSSHVSKCGSDVNLIIHELLPNLASGVFVHFHDIFFPFTYPLRLLRTNHFYNEAFILRAFLCENERFEIVMWNDYLKTHHREAFTEAMPDQVDDIAASFWLRRR